MMPYVRRGAAFRRGMGQAQTCNWFQNLMCGSSAVDEVMGVPCSQCNALVAPTLASNAGGATVPVGYDPTTGLVSPENTTGDTGTYPYQPSYPSNVSAAGASVCDWAEASWLDVTTWCGANWLIAGGVGLGLILFLKGKH